MKWKSFICHTPTSLTNLLNKYLVQPEHVFITINNGLGGGYCVFAYGAFPDEEAKEIDN